MLRTNVAGIKLYSLWALCAGVGALAGVLVLLGNPGNMGICGACFLRDTAGALGLFAGGGPRVFRPELVGLVLGAFVLRLVQRRFEGRAGSFAGARFFLGVWMGIGAMVFLGCPFRMLQRLGGGDFHALVGLVGFVLGVGAGKFCEVRGYTAGKTAVVVTAAGTPAIVVVVGGLILFWCRGLPFGPGPDDASGPAHAYWLWAAALALPAGVVLSLTGFCAVTAARQVYSGPRTMLIAAGLLVGGYAVVAASTGRLKLGFDEQPIAQGEHLWNLLAMVLVGLTGVLAGGCPVRLVILSGEGNGDAMVTAAGVLAGGALSHAMSLASTPTGATPGGRAAVLIGLAICSLYAVAVTFARRPT